MSTVPKQKPHRSRQNYATPPAFIAAVKARLGIDQFSHDFAADPLNRQAPTHFDEDTDALTVPRWELTLRECGATWGWLNPPFADIGPWAKRCLETAGAGGQIAFLVPAAVGSNWFRDYCDPKATGMTHVLFLNGRLAFMPDKPKWLYPKDCMLVLYSYGFQGYEVWNWRKQIQRLCVPTEIHGLERAV